MSSTPLDFSPQEINARLREQYSTIAQLAGGLAHEIKNPLSTIRLNMELLEEDLDDISESPQQKRALKKIKTIKQETVRLEDLLNEFLDFTRAHHLELTTADAGKELKEIVDFYRPQAKEAGVVISEFYASDLPTIRIDKRSFRRGILNLILNSLQAMPNGGELVVRTRLCGSEVAIDLIDTGCGMDHETIQRMFEPFYSTKRGGSGLGLPTVRKIIEGHGGRIAIQSEPGFGTQFTLTFPSLKRLQAIAEHLPEIVFLPERLPENKPVSIETIASGSEKMNSEQEESTKNQSVTVGNRNNTDENVIKNQSPDSSCKASSDESNQSNSLQQGNRERR